MKIVLPLLPAVLAVHLREDAPGCRLDTPDRRGRSLYQVDVPHAAHQGLELLVRVHEGTQVTVVREELI